MTRMELKRMLTLVKRADSMSPGEFAELDALSKKATRAMRAHPDGEVAQAVAALESVTRDVVERIGEPTAAEKFDALTSPSPTLAEIREAIAQTTAWPSTKVTRIGDGKLIP